MTTADWSRSELEALLDAARAYRQAPFSDVLARRAVALVFFNPSLRTRASFQVGVHQLGGLPVVLEPGSSSWPMEVDPGVIMDGGPEEHASEAVAVLARYFDMIGVRSFPKLRVPGAEWARERDDPVLKAFATFSDKPIINMETIVHPCQELALMMALHDHLKDIDGKKFVLSWVPHPQPLNTAVANSAVLIASKFGFDVTVLAPDEAYRLDPHYMQAAEGFAAAQGRSVEFTTDVNAAYDGAHVVYAKSWGALPFFGAWEGEAEVRAKGAAFMVDAAKLARTDNAVVSHCLPMRRNVKISDEVADSSAFLGLAEAENRLHVQKAVMARLAAGL